LVSWGSNWDSSRGVDRCSLIGDISNISIVVVRGVLDSLDTAVRESNRVGSLHISSSISSLSSIEVGVRVVISDSILVGVGLLSLISGRGSMGNSDRCSMVLNRGGMVLNRGSMGNHSCGRVSNSDGGSMVLNRGSMGQYSGDRSRMVLNRGSMRNNWGSMVLKRRSMRNNWGSMVLKRRSMRNNWGCMVLKRRSMGEDR